MLTQSLAIVCDDCKASGEDSQTAIIVSTIAGVTIAMVLVIVVVVLFIFFCQRKTKRFDISKTE